jgi:hypothetical protein
MLEVSKEAIRVSQGLVLWVVAGEQHQNCYWPGPEGLAWEWYKAGNHLWCPCIWHKVDATGRGSGIPGSGGRQGLRKDWEYVLMFKRPGALPWADNTACGHPPVIEEVGGEMSNRTAEGQRINQSIGNVRNNMPRAARWGGKTRTKDGDWAWGSKTRTKDGVTGRADGRPMPNLANPGNFLQIPEDEEPLDGGGVVNARVGGGHMGSRLCHCGEAPYPERLCEFFIRSYCPPGGIVLDPFVGSGTTLSVAVHEGRRGIGFDLRQEMIDLTIRRVETVTPPLFV